MNTKLTFRWLGIAGIELSIRTRFCSLIHASPALLLAVVVWQASIGCGPAQAAYPRADAIFITRPL
jgi:hypothetical protein